MGENKNTQIKVRITPVFRERVDEYCAKHHMNISEFIRMACEEIFKTEEEM